MLSLNFIYLILTSVKILSKLQNTEFLHDFGIDREIIQELR